ncbi:MAG: division/cell wall cluster transcriptional repressor MraZ [Clostridia bacterium]|nr:division/cell wall cluster transcriptional repressor MraZ [Clostridia bacterium]MBR5768000.1 division/cell wall cluster transcriptional repressor MraZ [Clostridia bacterium]
MFCGEYSHTLDSKNRIILPSKLREQLGQRVVLAKNVDKCVTLYTEEKWAQFCGKLDSLPDIETRRVRRFLYSTAFETELDSQGRILVPPKLCEYAGLEKSVTVIGVGDHVEIWDSEEWRREQSGERSEDIADVLMGLGF